MTNKLFNFNEEGLDNYLTEKVGYWYEIEHSSSSTIPGNADEILPRYRDIYNEDGISVGYLTDWYRNTVPVRDRGILVTFY